MTSAEFSLGSTFADVKSLEWTSGRSHVEARGRISDFRSPRLDASYEAHFDLQEAAAIARRTDLREGMADFKGSGHWSLEEFTSSGTLALRDLGWRDEQFAVKQASLNSDYSATDQQIKLTRLQGKLFGGTLVGDQVLYYAVGAYAEGPYTAFVPWTQLKPYLSPGGAAIFGGQRPKNDDNQ